MTDTRPILKAQRLTKTYVTGRISVSALKEVSLDFAEGAFVGITGASGSGKSTLLNLLGGLDTPTSGSIETGGKLISGMSKEELALYRRYRVGMIFQSFNLIRPSTALENVMLPLLFAGMPKRERRRLAAEALARVGLADRTDHRPAELSGGEQQRLAIARALVNGPKILLADEPTGNLDSQTSEEITQVLSDLHRNRGVTVIMVSHEEALLQRHAGEVIRLRDGEVIARGGAK